MSASPSSIAGESNTARCFAAMTRRVQPSSNGAAPEAERADAVVCPAAADSGAAHAVPANTTAAVVTCARNSRRPEVGRLVDDTRAGKIGERTGTSTPHFKLGTRPAARKQPRLGPRPRSWPRRALHFPGVASADVLSARRMTLKRWLLTVLSFALTLGVSFYMILGWSHEGASLALPLRAHLCALLAVACSRPAAHPDGDPRRSSDLGG